MSIDRGTKRRICTATTYLLLERAISIFAYKAFAEMFLAGFFCLDSLLLIESQNL